MSGGRLTPGDEDALYSATYRDDLIATVEAIVQRQIAAALSDAADAIEGWQEMADWAAAHTEDPDSAQNSAIRSLAYRRAARIVRARTT